MFITGVNNTGDKLFSGVIDTKVNNYTGDKDKFIAGDNNTGEQLSPVTTTPAINLLPVTRTRKGWRWRAAKDRKKLAISLAVNIGHGCRWCHWNRHEKLHS